MTGSKLYLSRVVVSFVLVSFMGFLSAGSGFAFGTPSASAAIGTQVGQAGGALTGKITMSGTGSPVAGAVVKLRNLNNQKEFFGRPTDAKGSYEVAGIEEGWYTVGVSTPAGDFNLSYGVYIKAREKARLSMALQQGGTIDGKGLTSKKGFFKTGRNGHGRPGRRSAALAKSYELTKSEKEVPR